jgi:hypothetical protein
LGKPISPASAFRRLHAFARCAEIGEEPRVPAVPFGVDLGPRHERPDRNPNDQVLPGRTRLVGGRARLPALRGVLLLEAEVDQRPELGIGLEDHIAAATAVPARRAALRNVLLPPPRNDAVAALPGRHVDRRLINELHG